MPGSYYLNWTQTLMLLIFLMELNCRHGNTNLKDKFLHHILNLLVFFFLFLYIRVACKKNIMSTYNLAHNSYEAK